MIWAGWGFGARPGTGIPAAHLRARMRSLSLPLPLASRMRMGRMEAWEAPAMPSPFHRAATILATWLPW